LLVLPSFKTFAGEILHLCLIESNLDRNCRRDARARSWTASFRRHLNGHQPAGCESALNIDQGFRTSCVPKQQFAAPVGVQSARRFTIPTAPPAATYLNVFTVEEYQSNGKTGKRWTKIGTAFPHKKGIGFSIELKAFPIGGRLVVLPPDTEERSK
jgi:hypothetical protein